MRRTVVIGIILVIAVLGLTVAVQASSGNLRTPTEPNRDVAVRPALVADQASSVRATDLDRVLARVNCKTVTCLNDRLTELTRFASRTERRLTKLDAFVDQLYACILLLPTTQYGEAPDGGTFGYIWSNSDNSEFKTTALDITMDTSVEPFDWFMTYAQIPECPVG